MSSDFSALAEYDGRVLPFPDAVLDVVLTSHVLAHLRNAPNACEVRRVLKPRGVAISIVPTATWRIWTSLCIRWRTSSASCLRRAKGHQNRRAHSHGDGS